MTWYSGQDPIHITRFDPSYAPPADGQRDQSQKEYLAVPTNILDIDALQASSVRFESFPDGLTTLPPSLTYVRNGDTRNDSILLTECYRSI